MTSVSKQVAGAPMIPAGIARALPYHAECVGHVAAPPPGVFAFLDDQAHLSSHMRKRSWMMGGGRMDVRTDAGGGRRVGSRIHIAGRVMGLLLSVDGVVTAYEPPRVKRWETVGEPRLLVIGPYRMAIELTAEGDGTALRIPIDYAWPERGLPHLLGRLFGGAYARWCTRRTVEDAVRHFGVDARRRLT